MKKQLVIFFSNILNRLEEFWYFVIDLIIFYVVGRFIIALEDLIDDYHSREK